MTREELAKEVSDFILDKDAFIVEDEDLGVDFDAAGLAVQQFISDLETDEEESEQEAEREGEAPKE